MRALTYDEIEILLSDVKAFLSITWEDETTDMALRHYIVSSIHRLDDIAGIELDYLGHRKDITNFEHSMGVLGHDLLLNRVFYMQQKGLDDFEDNYQSELVTLYNKGRILKRRKAVEENA